MDLRERGWEEVDWTHLAQYRGQRRAFVNTVMNLRFPKRQGICWLAQWLLLKKTLLHGVRKLHVFMAWYLVKHRDNFTLYLCRIRLKYLYRNPLGIQDVLVPTLCISVPAMAAVSLNFIKEKEISWVERTKRSKPCYRLYQSNYRQRYTK